MNGYAVIIAMIFMVQLRLPTILQKDLSLTGRTQITTYDLFRTEKFPYSATVYGREQAKGDYREDTRNLLKTIQIFYFRIKRILPGILI